MAVRPALGARRDKILVLITPDPETAMLIRRARRVADFMGADSLAIAVRRSGDRAGCPTRIAKTLERHLNFARNLHLETRIIEGRFGGRDDGGFRAPQPSDPDLPGAAGRAALAVAIQPRPAAKRRGARQRHADRDRLAARTARALSLSPPPRRPR